MNIFKWKFFPVWTVVLLLVAYVVSNAGFVNCSDWVAVCSAIDSENISEITVNSKDADSLKNADNSVLEAKCKDPEASESLKNNLHCVPTMLKTRKDALKIKNDQVKTQESAVEVVKTELNGTVKQINDKKQQKLTEQDAAKIASIDEEIKNLTATQEKQKLNLDARTADMNALIADRDKSVTEIQHVREQVAQRYTKRLVFMFCTAAFVILCIGAIIVALTTINNSLSKVVTAEGGESSNRNLRILWQVLTAIISVGVSAAIYIWFRDEYISIAGKLYRQSIWANGDISAGAIHFVNCLGFAATGWMVSAGNAVFYAVLKEGQVKRVKSLLDDSDVTEEKLLEETKAQKEIEQQELARTDLTEDQKAEITRKIAVSEKSILTLFISIKNRFEPYRKDITTILYIGALMLFTAMVRQKLLADWHLIFISTSAESPFYKLLSNFFNYTIGIQAAFYSILLLLIYVPVIYAIPPDEPQTAAGGNVTLFDRLRLPFSSDFVKKFAAVFSPVLAMPLVEFFNTLMGKTV